MNQRYYSLDVFRGATVALMILVNNPGVWSHIYDPLEHAPWHGLTPTDLVFPFFLFAVGNAMAFVMPRLRKAGSDAFWLKITKRSLVIFAVGLFLNWWPFFRWQGDELTATTWTWQNNDGSLSGVRILGVLQRIAICYFFAAVMVYYLKRRGAFVAGMVLLLLYWAITVAANPADPYSLQGWFGTRVDLAILRPWHMYHGEGIPFDPEGIMSTLPAIVQVIFGYLVGDYIMERSKNFQVQEGTAGTGIYRMLTVLFIASVGMLLGGYAWGQSFPVNKKIWTSSYTVLTSGMATALLATMIYAIEIKKMRGWVTSFFDVFGKNALFVFALSAFLPRGLALVRIYSYVNEQGKTVHVTPWNWIYHTVYRKLPFAAEFGSLMFAVTVIIFMWAICYWMDKKRIYIKV